MSDEALINAYDDCLNRLRNGTSLEACIQDYPQYAAHLRFLLMTSEVLDHHLEAHPQAIQSVQDRVRWRVMREALQMPQPTGAWQRWGLAVAVLAILFFMTGLLYVSRQSLPGEPLYSLKNQVDELRISLGQDADQIEIEHLRDIQDSLDNGLVADVEFEGEVQAIKTLESSSEWQIAGIPVIVTAKTTIEGNYGLGSIAKVVGYTTPYHELFATKILIVNDEANKTLTPTPSLTITATPTPIKAPTFTATPPVVLTETPFVSCTLQSLTANRINIRAGASTSYDVVGELRSGEQYVVIGENANDEKWYAIYLANGTVGWVFGDLAELNGNCNYIPNLTSPIISSTSGSAPDDNADSSPTDDSNDDLDDDDDSESNELEDESDNDSDDHERDNSDDD